MLWSALRILHNMEMPETYLPQFYYLFFCLQITYLPLLGAGLAQDRFVSSRLIG